MTDELREKIAHIVRVVTHAKLASLEVYLASNPPEILDELPDADLLKRVFVKGEHYMAICYNVVYPHHKVTQEMIDAVNEFANKLLLYRGGHTSPEWREETKDYVHLDLILDKELHFFDAYIAVMHRTDSEIKKEIVNE